MFDAVEERSCAHTRGLMEAGRVFDRMNLNLFSPQLLLQSIVPFSAYTVYLQYSLGLCLYEDPCTAFLFCSLENNMCYMRSCNECVCTRSAFMGWSFNYLVVIHMMIHATYLAERQTSSSGLRDCVGTVNMQGMSRDCPCTALEMTTRFAVSGGLSHNVLYA